VRDDLAVGRLQPADPGLQPGERVGGLRLARETCGIRQVSRRLQRDGALVATSLAADMAGGGIVGDAVDPSPEAGAPVKGRKAAPEGDVNILQEVAPALGIRLGRLRQPR